MDKVRPAVMRGGQMATREAAEQLAARIRDMIPKEGGWFDIYRQSIEFIEISSSEWGVAGVAELPFDEVEAASSLIWFQGGDSAAQLLSPYNPWTVDTLPAVKGGISADLLVRPASEGEVTSHRKRLQAELGAIDLLLTRISKPVEENVLPTINGHIFADIDFLVRRLEFGLGGFPRTPIWVKAESEMQNILKSPEVAKDFLKGLGK